MIPWTSFVIYLLFLSPSAAFASLYYTYLDFDHESAFAFYLHIMNLSLSQHGVFYFGSVKSRLSFFFKCIHRVFEMEFGSDAPTEWEFLTVTGRGRRGIGVPINTRPGFPCYIRVIVFFNREKTRSEDERTWGKRWAVYTF